MIKIISHRGNINGSSEDENKPSRIDKTIELGFDVEIDLRLVNNKLFLGHDTPQYEIDLQWLNNRKKYLWIHAKDKLTVEYLLNTDFRWFWHENDKMTLTSKGDIWLYPDNYSKYGITVVLEKNKMIPLDTKGICTDYCIQYLKKNLEFNFKYDKNENKLFINSNFRLDLKVSILKENFELIYSTLSNFNYNTIWYAPKQDLFSINNILIQFKDIHDNLICEEKLTLNKEIINYDNFVLYKGIDRNKIKCFIVNYNRLILTKNMADYLHNAGVDVYIIDNDSTYEPLLKYYETTSYNVIRMNSNYGFDVFWKQDIYNKLKIEGRYLLTDPDLDLSELPKDFLEIFENGLNKYPQFDKCGVSLKIDDLPDTQINRDIIEWETKNWKNPLDDLYLKAEVDTTLALYKVNKHNYNAIRTNLPYCVRHLPWYYPNEYEKLPEDEKFYFKNLKRLYTFWSDKLVNNDYLVVVDGDRNNFYDYTYDISINKLYISSNIDLSAIVSIMDSNRNNLYSTFSEFEKNTKFWCVAGVDLYQYNSIIVQIKDLNHNIIKETFMTLNKNWKINFNI